jgi:MFS family permease
MPPSFFDREGTVAPARYNRFLVPPAALAVHLSIGQVYAFSTFNLPLTKLIGITHSAPEDWKLTEVGWTFSIAIAILGISAAVFGHWVERVGPRKSMFTAALCFGGGFIVAAFGIKYHQLWLLYLGYGVLGGCGLGIGYISPVSTLIKWFPDRPGMATGMAIMGFGGGALIAAPLSLLLMDHFRSLASMGVMETFVTMGVIYFMYMMIGVITVRVPSIDWKPAGWIASEKPRRLVTTANVAVDTAWRTPQFWLLWVILCMNVTAGIGVLSQASPMIQEIFLGRVTPAMAAGFVGLLSLFNMGGRFFWAATSDYIGRRVTYTVFLLLGIMLYSTVPSLGLKDLCGIMNVGAIHGRLLTAWAVAGVLGPMLVNYIRQFQIDHGVAKAQAYSVTLYIMCGLLAVGLLCNLAVQPANERYHHETPG